MYFEGEFFVPGTPAEVMLRFAEVERVVCCMPGATIDGRDADGSYHGTMIVSFGPKRITFKGSVRCDFDAQGCRGTLTGRGAANLRSARIEMTTRFSTHEAPGYLPQRPMSLVKLNSDAELQGVLADFAQTGGVAVAKVIMREFARRMAEEFATPVQDARVPVTVEPVKAHWLVWNVVRDLASSLWRKFRTKPNRSS